MQNDYLKNKIMQKTKLLLSQKAANKVIGKNIRKIRTDSGVYITALAEHLNVTKQLISEYEKGKVAISTDKLHALAKYFEVDINNFFKGLYVPEKK